MSREYCIHHVPGQHLTFQDREQIAIIYNRNLQRPAHQQLSLRKLAIQIGLPYSTLQEGFAAGGSEARI